MKRATVLITALVAGALVLGLVGSAPAAIEFPDGFNPDDYEDGVWFLGSEPGGSWKQGSWANFYGKRNVHYQFRICTNPLDPDAPQFFQDPGLEVSHYGIPGPPAPTVSYGSNGGVDDALMWAAVSAPSPPGYYQGDKIDVTFGQGTINNYPNPYTCTWDDTPEFLLQMQVYGYSASDATKTVYRLANKEAYFDGTNWHFGTSQSEPSPWYASGTVRGWGAGYEWACPEWTLNSPIPEPGSLAVWGLLGSAVLAGAWWRRRRRKAA
jgi:hypothetical protein